MQDSRCEISVPGSPQQDPQDHLCKMFVSGSLVQDLRVRISAPESCLGPLGHDDSPPDCKRATCPAFRVMDAPDHRTGFHLEIKMRNFKSIPGDQHAPSPQSVTFRNQKTQLYQHSAHWTRMISAEGRTWKSVKTWQRASSTFSPPSREGLLFQSHQ